MAIRIFLSLVPALPNAATQLPQVAEEEIGSESTRRKTKKGRKRQGKVALWVFMLMLSSIDAVVCQCYCCSMLSLLLPCGMHLLLRPCGIYSLLRPCGIHSLLQPCGIHLLFQPCGIYLLFQPCGTHLLFQPCGHYLSLRIQGYTSVGALTCSHSFLWLRSLARWHSSTAPCMYLHSPTCDALLHFSYLYICCWEQRFLGTGLI